MNVLLFRNLTEEQVKALQTDFPAVEFRQTTDPTELVRQLDWAEAVFGNPPVGLLQARQRPLWLQIVSSGIDEYLALRGGPITVTTAHGVHARIIAQHVLGMMLWFARGQPHFAACQINRRWDRNPAIPQDLSRQAVGLIGCGEIGRAVARLLQPIGPRVLAVSRIGGQPPTGVDELHALAGLDAVLEQSDHLVLALPLTSQSHRILDSARIARLPAGAVVHNVSRGALIDETALIAALAAGRLGGAALDVFEEEPLSTASPLWTMPNVVITPHLAGHHRHLAIPTLDRFRENLARRLSGETLLHAADLDRGY